MYISMNLPISVWLGVSLSLSLSIYVVLGLELRALYLLGGTLPLESCRWPFKLILIYW
jgi:hypothetical protein